ncbi:MAG: helix-turn-helix transcriptional regulator [Acidobacteria bacterium]|nr:helix-turn-helix transcriptional regulator [Acidobacteriota bacterium]
MPPRANPFLKQLGNRIRELRARAGLSQEALADEAGLDRSYMSGVERGVRNVSVLALAKIAKALHQPITALFDTT